MRILFLTHSFNSLTQRLFVELRKRGHEVSIEFDINDAVAEQAVELFQPELIVAPFLKRAIPDSIWKNHLCIIVHPGIKGDRGPSSVDWAIMRGEERWGVTCLQADAEMDAGDIWASVEFPMRKASKSSLYRNEITEAALEGVLETIDKVQDGKVKPQPLDYSDPEIKGQWYDLMSQQDRAIDWQKDSTEQVLSKIRASDSMPGLRDRIGDREFFIYNAFAEGELAGTPGHLLATRNGAVCRATVDGAVWITHLRLAERKELEPNFKLPAAMLIAEECNDLSDLPLAPEAQPDHATWQEIRYRQKGQVGYLHFDFCNGAMDTEQCLRLRDAVREAKTQDIRVLVLMGGSEFWSNGIHLNQIEAAESPADESWRNINAMDDLCLEIIDSPDHFVIAAMQGNAGAGGVFFGLTADQVIARHSVVLNPHYKSMGNLFGSEYWTYLLPRRVGDEQAQKLTQNRLPIGAEEGVESGLLDVMIEADRPAFVTEIEARAQTLSNDSSLVNLLQAKAERLQQDHQIKPLQQYREEELEKMKLNFYGFDPSYHVARYHFVEKLPKARTPAYLAKHRCINEAAKND